MIERLRLINFQGHDDYKVEFAPGITTFIGRSDAGKSSILRALRWIATNRPAGTGNIQHGADTAKAVVWLDGGRKIKRERGKSENTYHLDDQEYKAFGADVPAAVAAVLNTADINFQDQHDPPFWLGLSPGEVSRQINAIIDLGIIDECLGKLAAGHRKATTELEVAERNQTESAAAVAALEYVPKLDADLIEIEKLADTTDAASNLAAKVWSHLKAARTLVTHRDNARRFVVRTEEVICLGDSAQQAADVARSVVNLHKQATAARTTRDAAAAFGRAAAAVVARGEAAITAAKRADYVNGHVVEAQIRRGLVRPVPDFTGVERAADKAVKASEQMKAVYKIIGEIITAREKVTDAHRVRTEAQAAYDAETQGQCPICGSKL